MKVSYNNFALDGIGEVTLRQRREYEGGEAPQRAKVTLEVKLALFQRCYADNYALLQQARAALATPNAALVWQNDATGEEYVNQTATLTAEDLPEEWGTYYQEMNLTFFYYENLDTGAQNLPLTFQPAGGPAITFTQVTAWAEGASTERFATLRSQRRETRGRLEVKGIILGDPTQSLAARRAALAAQVPALRAAMNSAEGRLTFGTPGQQLFNNTVRITEFKCDADQAITSIGFSFTASYTLFPDEADYATTEATFTQTDNFNGEVTLAAAGKVQAPTEALARAKLKTVIAAALKQYGYAAGTQQLEFTATPNLIDANGDGTTFTELTFGGRWRRFKASNQTATFTAGGLAAPFGNVRTWASHYAATRFNALRDQRERAVVEVEAAGTLTAAAGPGTLTAEDRRAQLLRQQLALLAAVNSKAGILAYGSFTQAVRVDDFKADINQAETGIDWTLKAHYTVFPDEDDYATAEVTFGQTDNVTGELVLAVQGKIQAADEPTGRTKLAAVVAAALKQYGYTAGQLLELDVTPNLVSANADGDTFTELAFSGRWRKWCADNQTATYQSKSADPIPFGNVKTWADHYTATRFDPLRDQRERAQVDIEFGGTYAGDPALSLADRRAALLAMQRRMKAEVNSPGGTLVYGSFTQAVRVDDFKAEINQAITGIDWTCKAHYTLFPTEADYATVTATAAVKINFTGEETLTLAGKVQANSEAAARAKLAAVFTAFLTQYGYAGKPGVSSQQTELDVTPNLVSANADGDTFTELTFSGTWRKWAASNQRATFQAAGSAAAVPFGNVKVWEDGYKAERFDTMRSERRHATGTISAAGTYAGDPGLALKDRRAALLAMQRKMKAECNHAEGVLVYGDWSQTVRIEEFIAHVNQAETGIDWALTASYTLFPNEGGYAVAEFSADVRNDTETGDSTLTFAGEILAPNGSLARAKLGSLRTATLAVYGFTLAQQTGATATAHDIAANGDATGTVPEGMETAGDVAGVSFLKLDFNETYRQRMPGAVLNSNYTISTRDDTATGLVATTYAGSVTATGTTADAAAAAAILRAIAIGANRQGAIGPTAFLKAQSLTLQRRQTSAAAPEEFVRADFSYEYQSKLGAGRAYAEVNTQTSRDSFGTDTVAVNGFVVAKDFATATLIYQQQKTPYAGLLIRQETVTQVAVLSETVSALAVPADTLAFNAQQLKLEFSFTVHLPKAAGMVTARYAISVQRDFRPLIRTCRLRGSLFAFNRAAADTFLAALAAPFGQLMASNREEARDFTPTADVFTKLDFEDVYEDRLTGVSGLIEMQVTESVTYSGTRWAVQQIPFSTNGGAGVSIPQAVGLTEGSRTVSGTVSAATRATAEAWAAQYRKMLTGDNQGGFYPQPEVWRTTYDFAPRVDGIAVDGLGGAGSVANVRIYRVEFTFAEILPYYLSPA